MLVPMRVTPKNWTPDAPITLKNGTKTTISALAQQRDLVLHFFYTRCNGTCPVTTQNLKKVARMMPGKFEKNALILSISLDPERDTVGNLNVFAGRHNLPQWWQVARCDRAVIDVLSAVDVQEGAMSPAVDNFYSSLYLRCDAPNALLCILAHDTVAVLCGAACRGSWASPSPTLRPKVITRVLSRLPTAGRRRRGRCCSLPSLYFLSCL